MALPQDEVLASRKRRLYAATTDGLLGLAIVVPLAAYVGYFAELNAGAVSWTTRLLVIGLWLAQYALLHGWLLHRRGQTIGKRLFGLRIASLDDGRIPRLHRTLLMRHAVFVLLSQPPLWGSFVYLANVLAIARHDRRCLHDLLAYTKVVQCRTSRR